VVGAEQPEWYQGLDPQTEEAFPERIVLEAAGGYEHELALQLSKAELGSVALSLVGAVGIGSR